MVRDRVGVSVSHTLIYRFAVNSTYPKAKLVSGSGIGLVFRFFFFFFSVMIQLHKVKDSKPLRASTCWKCRVLWWSGNTWCWWNWCEWNQFML